VQTLLAFGLHYFLIFIEGVLGLYLPAFIWASARGLAPSRQTYGDYTMSRSLGIITPTEDGNFEGFLSMGVRDNVRVLKNSVKTPKSKEPDYRIIGDKLGECGAGWNKVGQTSGKPFISITLEHPNISDRKVYASTGMVKGAKDKSLAMIWNPEN
jgi:uncharacterized protein (DUF736 family)